MPGQNHRFTQPNGLRISTLVEDERPDLAHDRRRPGRGRHERFIRPAFFGRIRDNRAVGSRRGFPTISAPVEIVAPRTQTD